MVVAFLRGLLKPELKYGLRSLIAENVVLEALGADLDATDMKVAALLQTIRLEVTKPEARAAQATRAGHLFSQAIDYTRYDLYDWDRLRRREELKSAEGISLYQLYHLLAKHDKLSALHPTAQPSPTQPQ